MTQHTLFNVLNIWRTELVSGEPADCGSGCKFSLQMYVTRLQKCKLYLSMDTTKRDCKRVHQCPFGFWSSVLNLLQTMSVTRFKVPLLNEQYLNQCYQASFVQLGCIWRHHIDWCARCVCGAKVLGWIQSVLTCVTCASAVWLVDWMNIGWVSSCPAGIVTCWIWYNCWRTQKQIERLKVYS